MVKYKNFGSLLASRSKASISKRLSATQSSSVATKTNTAATHQSSNQRAGSTATTKQQDHYKKEDDPGMDGEWISTHSSSTKGRSHRQKRQPFENSEVLDRKNERMLEEYHMVEEREPRTNRGGSNRRVQLLQVNDSTGNIGQTTPTATSASRRTENVSTVAYVSGADAMSIHNMDDDALQHEHTDSRMAAESRNLRRQRLAKRYGHNEGNSVVEDNAPLGSDAATSIVQPHFFPSRVESAEQPVSSHPTSTSSPQPVASPLCLPTETKPAARVEASGSVPASSPTVKGLQFLAKKRLKAQQHQRAIPQPIADQHASSTTQSSLQQNIHEVDGRPTMSEPSDDQPASEPADDSEQHVDDEPLVTLQTSSTGMSDSLHGSDTEDGSSSASTSFPESGQQEAFLQPGEDILTLEESSPVEFHHLNHHDMAECNDEDVEESTTISDAHDDDDPSVQLGLLEQQRPEFNHTPLKVTEEASNADDFDSLQQDSTMSLSMRQDSSSESYKTELDENADCFFSVHQRNATQHSLSADEADATKAEEDAKQVAMKERSTEGLIVRKPSRSVLTISVILKFVFMSVVIYYTGFIVNVWEPAETFLQQQLNIDVGTVGSPDPEHQHPTPADHETDVDWQHLSHLVQKALGTYHIHHAPPPPSELEFSEFPTRNPRTDWERELEEVLWKHEALLHRVKTIIRRHGNSHDDTTTFFRDEELANELRELRKEKHSSFGGSRRQHDNNGENTEPLL